MTGFGQPQLIQEGVPYLSDPDGKEEILFQAWPKIPRLKRGCVISEKIDGSNACIIITADGQIGAQSRSRLLTARGKEDNFGFYGWVMDNKDELMRLGPGRHYGEWWGCGIQRGYGLKEKRFSLFNAGRWGNPLAIEHALPKCCGVVPVLWDGPFTTDIVDMCIRDLIHVGSSAVPGFMKPEGVVVYLTAARQLYKVMCENDEVAKGE